MIISSLHDLAHLSVLADIFSNIFFLLNVRFGEKSAGDPGSADWSETSEVSTTLYQHKCTPLILRMVNTETAVKGPFNWLDGKRVTPEDTVGSFRNLSPRTGKLLSDVPSSGEAAVSRAVASCRSAQVSVSASQTSE